MTLDVAFLEVKTCPWRKEEKAALTFPPSLPSQPCSVSSHPFSCLFSAVIPLCLGSSKHPFISFFFCFGDRCLLPHPGLNSNSQPSCSVLGLQTPLTS